MAKKKTGRQEKVDKNSAKYLDSLVSEMAKGAKPLQEMQKSTGDFDKLLKKLKDGLAKKQDGKGGGKADKSTEKDVMQLQRMIQKRQQMFDTLRQVIDKQNETAQKIIQSIGR